MLRLISLADNSELPVKTEDLPRVNLTGIWLELVNPTPEELQAVSEKTEIPINRLSLPKTANIIDLRLEPNYGIIHFVIVKEIFAAKETYPVIIAFSKNCLVTVSRKEAQKTMDLAKERLSDVKLEPPALAVYYILEQILSEHFDVLEKMENIASKFEEEVVAKADSTIIKRILRIKSRLTSFNKILWYERGVIFNLKKSEAEYITAKIRNLYDTAHEYITRQIDIVETYREILSDAINAYLSTVSNKINFSIRSLTVITLYLSVITTITSFPNTVATFFGIAQFGNANPLLIFTIIFLSIVVPTLWLWKRKWLRLPADES